MKPVPAASAATLDAYATIAAMLGARGGAIGAMFGMPVIKRGGKAFAGRFGDALVFKLSGDAHAAAIALAGAALFDPSGMGRAMKAWVVVPKAHRARWAMLAQEAFAELDGGATSTAKKPVAKKSVAKKPVARKPVARKPVAKKSAR